MPFGIPCPDDDVDSMPLELDRNNTRLQNLVYNIVFPIGQMITINERVLGQIHKHMNLRLKPYLNAAAQGMGDVLEALGVEVYNHLNTNACTLAGVQSAIAMLPARETPDIPAADIRSPAWPPPGGDTAIIVSNTVRQASADIDSLLHLLYLLGITPAQVRRYLDMGTIPEVYMCPRPEAHPIPEIAPPPEIVSPTEPFTVPAGYAADAPRPMVAAPGFWED